MICPLRYNTILSEKYIDLYFMCIQDRKQVKQVHTKIRG